MHWLSFWFIINLWKCKKKTKTTQIGTLGLNLPDQNAQLLVGGLPHQTGQFCLWHKTLLTHFRRWRHGNLPNYHEHWMLSDSSSIFCSWFRTCVVVSSCVLRTESVHSLLFSAHQKLCCWLLPCQSSQWLRYQHQRRLVPEEYPVLLKYRKLRINVFVADCSASLLTARTNEFDAFAPCLSSVSSRFTLPKFVQTFGTLSVLLIVFACAEHGRLYLRPLRAVINQSIKTDFYSAICRKRIRGAKAKS